jgi:hypothetical protein
MPNSKAIYRDFCASEGLIPIFSQAWWLDATAGASNWDVAVVERDGAVLATMPYVIKKRYGMTVLTQPALTQVLGPWLRPGDGKYSKNLASQKDLMEQLIEQLPPFHHYAQNWHHSITNWLPFYWKGFRQTTRYTYIIDDLNDLENVYAQFEHSKRKNISKSEKLVSVVFDISADDFYTNHELTLAKQGQTISYSRDYFSRLYAAGYSKSAATTLGAYDAEGNLHAALFIVWDQNSAYDLISTIDPDYRTFGAASLLVKAAIKFVSGKTKKFDFEGSMIESVERSFRQFGAKQTQYFAVSKTPSWLLKTMFFLKDLKAK